MSNFNPAAGQVVADDLQTAFAAMDKSVHRAARLVTTFIEAAEGSSLAPSTSQRALLAMGGSINKIIEGRGEMISAQRIMVSIKSKSNLDVYDYGCFMEAGAKPVPTTPAIPLPAQHLSAEA